MPLAGWNPETKYKITIDSSKIDGDLVDFPVAIVLSSGTGTNNIDATNIFTTFGSDANRTKIAVTDVNDNQLYVEIEHWDHANERATLWVKVPGVASETDTVLYLYYDATQSGNGSYVGDIGDIPAQNVWDQYFEAVYHFSQDPSGGGAGEILESTSNAIHGKANYMESEDLTDSPSGKAYDFDGAAEYVDVPDNSNLTFGDGASDDDPLTIETFVNMDEPTLFRLAEKRDGSNLEYIFFTGGSDQVAFFLYDNVGSARLGRQSSNGSESGNANQWIHYAGRYNGDGTNAGQDVLRNGVAIDVTSSNQGSYFAMHDTGTPLWIGGQTVTPSYGDGEIAEVRISRFARADAWLKATTYTLNNNLLSFESLAPTFTFSNVVPVHLSTVYGTTQQLSVTTVISGGFEEYIYDAEFYDGNTDIQIGSTVGIASGSPASIALNTPSGIDYYWYMQASSSGVVEASSTYSFTNRFLCAGDVYVSDVPVSGIAVRLYRRSTGELVGQTTSTGVVATFEVESTYNEDHYAVALYSDDTTNALIYDWINPE